MFLGSLLFQGESERKAELVWRCRRSTWYQPSETKTDAHARPDDATTNCQHCYPDRCQRSPLGRHTDRASCLDAFNFVLIPFHSLL